MTLVQLRHLISLAQTGSFSKSAVALFLTQPALSRSYRALETELPARSLRERTIDAMLVDARSLTPAPDLRATETYELRGSFLRRRGHPLARRRAGGRFEQLRASPIAPTPLSDEVARVLVERYGPQAHPQRCVTLHCEELPSLVELTRPGDTVLIAIRAAAPDLVELALQPPLNATARFAIVTLAGRSEAPSLPRATGEGRAGHLSSERCNPRVSLQRAIRPDLPPPAHRSRRPVPSTP